MKMHVLAAAVFVLGGLAAPAHASGSGSRGGGGGFGGGANFENSVNQQAERQIRRGRSQVRKHITCKKCAYHDRLNQNTAVEVAQAVVNGDFEIKQRDRQAVLLYLRDRYRF